MATLDEKILDGPNVGYCSDSDEDPGLIASADADYPGSKPSQGSQTGPKGVLNDYRLHKAEVREKNRQKEEWLLKEAQRLTVAPSKPVDDDDEDELEKIRRQRLERMREMRKGRIMEVPDTAEFLRITDAEDPDLIFIHIYRDGLEESHMLNDALLVLGNRIMNAKFFKVKVSLLRTSSKFEEKALPTLQIYHNGQLVGNFVRITDRLGEEFDGRDLIKLLQQEGIQLTLKTARQRDED